MTVIDDVQSFISDGHVFTRGEISEKFNVHGYYSTMIRSLRKRGVNVKRVGSRPNLSREGKHGLYKVV